MLKQIPAWSLTFLGVKRRPALWSPDDAVLTGDAVANEEQRRSCRSPSRAFLPTAMLSRSSAWVRMQTRAASSAEERGDASRSVLTAAVALSFGFWGGGSRN